MEGFKEPTCSCTHVDLCIRDGCEKCCHCSAPFNNHKPYKEEDQALLIETLRSERDKCQAENVKLRRQILILGNEFNDITPELPDG